MLHLFCGKIASGKSSLAAHLAAVPGAVLLTEDKLLSNLYPAEILTLEDYVRATTRLRQAIAPLIRDLLNAGLTVVLDFQANTPSARAWSRSLLDGTTAGHRLHYLQASDDVCKRRLSLRNQSGSHAYHVSDADFELFTSHFVAPDPQEGFQVEIHDQR